MTALRDAGLDPVPVPTIAVEFEPPGGDLDAAAGLLRTYAWVVITSANGARAILMAAERIRDRRSERRAGRPSGRRRDEVLEQRGHRGRLPAEPEQRHRDGRRAAGRRRGPGPRRPRRSRRRGARGRPAGPRGARWTTSIAYRTREAPESSAAAAARAPADGPIAAVLFTSGSTVRGLVALGHGGFDRGALDPGHLHRSRRRRRPPGTAGFRILAVSATPDVELTGRDDRRALAVRPQETP